MNEKEKLQEFEWDVTVTFDDCQTLSFVVTADHVIAAMVTTLENILPIIPLTPTTIHCEIHEEDQQ